MHKTMVHWQIFFENVMRTNIFYINKILEGKYTVGGIGMLLGGGG